MTPSPNPIAPEPEKGSSQDNTTPIVLGHEADNFNSGGAR